MTNDVRQWLGEIKNLQQKLEQAKKERDEAFASAANWRGLYETEAQQRRTEANLHRQAVDALRNEQEQSQGIAQTDIGDLPQDGNLLEGDLAERQALLQSWVDRLKTPEALRSELLKVLQECDRLTQALQAEQANHNRTREELTLALADTMEMLSRTRVSQADHSIDPLPMPPALPNAPALPTLPQADS